MTWLTLYRCLWLLAMAPSSLYIFLYVVGMYSTLFRITRVLFHCYMLPPVNVHPRMDILPLPPTFDVLYSGKFSLGKNFAKPRCVVLRENFAKFIFAHMRLGEIKFHGIVNNYSFQDGRLAVSSSLETCLAAAESPFSLSIWTSVHY